MSARNDDVPASHRNSSNYANSILFAFHAIFVCYAMNLDRLEDLLAVYTANSLTEAARPYREIPQSLRKLPQGFRRMWCVVEFAMAHLFGTDLGRGLAKG